MLSLDIQAWEITHRLLLLLLLFLFKKKKIALYKRYALLFVSGKEFKYKLAESVQITSFYTFARPIYLIIFWNIKVITLKAVNI